MDTNPSPSSSDWAYLAGFIDGEGCIAARARNRPWLRLRVQVHITQKYGGILHHLDEIFEVGALYKVNNKGEYIQTRWSITGNEEVLYLLKGVLPYLKLKKSQAELCIKALTEDLDHDQRLELEQRVKDLKKIDPFIVEVV